MHPHPPIALLLAAGPQATGGPALLARASAACECGTPLRVLLTGEGLDWAGDARLARLGDGVDVAVCSRHAREAGWTAASTPSRVRWSSLATWLAEVQQPPPARLWTALP